ncbi:MAG: C40 family peptidase [Gemmatimonadales bacterium]
MTLLRQTRKTTLLAAFLVASVAGSLSAQSSTFSKSEKPFATISRMFSKAPDQDSLVQLAREQVGLRYKMGAKTPGKAFDCSGLVQWVMARFNLDVPRTSREQSKIGLEIPKDPTQLLPGDLLYFGKGKKVDHIGIYVGDGRYVHAANRRKGVIESSLPTGRWATNWWKGVRRIFESGTSPDSLTAATADSILGAHIIS